MAQAKDIYHSIANYQAAIASLEADPRLPEKNRQVAAAWVRWKEHQLAEEMDSKEREENRIRHAKTLAKYCVLLRNICRWFPDFSKITEKDLIRFKEDFYADKLVGVSGRKLTEKSDYINKVIKSDFFKVHLKLGQQVESVFMRRRRSKPSAPVVFITEDDLDAMYHACPNATSRVAFQILFYTGVRVGELLNLKKKDIEAIYNPETKQNYYMVHVWKEYSKSREDRSIPITSEKAIRSLRTHLKAISDNDPVISLSYAGIRKNAAAIAEKAKIKTKPEATPFHIHIFRKSFPPYAKSIGYDKDEIKAMLGHKPSSTVIDAYWNYASIKLEPKIKSAQIGQYADLEKQLEAQRSANTALQRKLDQIQAAEAKRTKDAEERLRQMEERMHKVERAGALVEVWRKKRQVKA